jgi:hypothetical protein
MRPTKPGDPRPPLMLSYDTPLVPWEKPREDGPWPATQRATRIKQDCGERVQPTGVPFDALVCGLKLPVRVETVGGGGQRPFWCARLHLLLHKAREVEQTVRVD